MIIQALLVGVTVCMLDFLDVWLCNPMITRPLIVGTAMGIALGDVKTGVQVGASLELVFMGVMAIGGTVPPDSIHGTAVGTAYAIILGKGIETAFALAVPASIVCQMLFVPGIGLRSLFTPYVERQVSKGNWKALQRIFPVVSISYEVFNGTICGLAVLLGADVMRSFIDSVPQTLLDGMGVAANMLGAVGFGLLLKMMWQKKLAVYFFLGFIMAAYCGMPLMAIAIIGVILVIVLFFEGEFSKRRGFTETIVTSDQGEEELFDD